MNTKSIRLELNSIVEMHNDGLHYDVHGNCIIIYCHFYKNPNYKCILYPFVFKKIPVLFFCQLKKYQQDFAGFNTFNEFNWVLVNDDSK